MSSSTLLSNSYSPKKMNSTDGMYSKVSSSIFSILLIISHKPRSLPSPLKYSFVILRIELFCADKAIKFGNFLPRFFGKNLSFLLFFAENPPIVSSRADVIRKSGESMAVDFMKPVFLSPIKFQFPFSIFSHSTPSLVADDVTTMAAMKIKTKISKTLRINTNKTDKKMIGISIFVETEEPPIIFAFHFFVNFFVETNEPPSFLYTFLICTCA